MRCAAIIKKSKRDAGILTGSGHLDNPIDSIKTHPVLVHSSRLFTGSEVLEYVDNLVKEYAADEMFGIESVLNTHISGNCMK